MIITTATTNEDKSKAGQKKKKNKHYSKCNYKSKLKWQKEKKITFLTYDKGIKKQYTVMVTWSVIDGKQTGL